MTSNGINSTPGTKRNIEFVSPSSSCGSPDLKTQVIEDQLSNFSKSKMADGTGAVIPAWFLKFDEDFEKRVMIAVGKKVEECLVQSKEARDLAGEARDNCEGLEKQLDSMTAENRDLKLRVESLQEKYADLEQKVTATQKQLHSITVPLEKIDTKVNDLENYGRRENLIFEGVREDPQETAPQTVQKIYHILENDMHIPHARQIRLDGCHRVGPHSPGKPRRVIVRFNWRYDRDRVWAARSSLSRPCFVSEDFSQRTTQIRQKLIPAMNAARNNNEKSYIKGETLLINGTKYTHTDLHKLPSHITPGIRTDSKRVAFFGTDAPLSNFHPATFTEGGISYSSTEQYYQVKKAEHFLDDQRAAKMMRMTNPVDIMRLGKNVNNYKEDEWEPVCRDVMMRGNLAKYTQNPCLRSFLLATGDKELLESSRHDLYWGTGVGLNSKYALTTNEFRGKNHMGRLLSSVREHMEAFVRQEAIAQTIQAENQNRKS